MLSKNFFKSILKRMKHCEMYSKLLFVCYLRKYKVDFKNNDSKLTVTALFKRRLYFMSSQLLPEMLYAFKD